MLSAFSFVMLMLYFTSSALSSTTSQVAPDSVLVNRSLRYYNFEYTKGDDDYYKRASKKNKEAQKATDDDMTFTQKVHKMEQNAKSNFYRIMTTSPKDWTAGNWGFFFFLVVLSCGATFLLYGAIFGFRRRLDSPDTEMGYQNMDYARRNRLEFPMRAVERHDEDDDTIMRARSID